MEYGLTQAFEVSYAFVPVTEAQFDSIRSAASATTLALSIEEKYDLVLENYLELEQAVLSTAANWMLRPSASAQRMWEESALYNRKILNLMSAGRTYSHHVPHHLNGLLEGGAVTAEAALSTAYDERIGYRALSALRNYAQHRGMPVHMYGYEQGWRRLEDGAQSASYHAARLALVPEELELDGGFKRAVLDELHNIGTQVDLMWLIRDYLDGLSGAHARIRDAVDGCLGQSDRIIEDASRRFVESANDDPVHLVLVSREDSGMPLERIPVNCAASRFRVKLRQRNPLSVDLASSYVSSEVEAAGT